MKVNFVQRTIPRGICSLVSYLSSLIPSCFGTVLLIVSDGLEALEIALAVAEYVRSNDVLNEMLDSSIRDETIQLFNSGSLKLLIVDLYSLGVLIPNLTLQLHTIVSYQPTLDMCDKKLRNNLLFSDNNCVHIHLISQ